MQKLIRGVHHFQQSVFAGHRKLFEQLSEGQKPLALFITCSDSRINPNLITHTEPGELFILRNAGNIIPAYGAGNGGEAPTIEFAVAGLGVRDIIVCGHSLCGAMKGLLKPETLQRMPAVTAWLNHAEATRRIVQENYQDIQDDEERVNIATQENVLRQIENLQTHPAVAVALARGELKLHAWVYTIESGEVFAYSIDDEQFMPLAEHSTANVLPVGRLKVMQAI
jgi:carbonic anhydrase